MGKSINPMEVWPAGASGSEAQNTFVSGVYPRACGGTARTSRPTFPPSIGTWVNKSQAAVRVQNTFVNHRIDRFAHASENSSSLPPGGTSRNRANCPGRSERRAAYEGKGGGARAPHGTPNEQKHRARQNLVEPARWDGIFEGCFKSRVQENAANGLGNLQAALALAPDIPVSARNLLASGFSFRLRLVVASGRRGGAGASA